MLVNDSSILSNNGTVKGTVTIAENASVNGNGTFATTILQSNALLYVGTSPGFQQHNDLTLVDSSRLGFYLDGITAATLANHGSGTYSNLSVSNSLTVNGTVNTEVEVGLGILAAGTGEFTLNLIQTEGSVTRIGNSSYLPGNAKWNDDVFSFGLKADWNIQIAEKTTLSPFIGIDYVHAAQERFTEKYTNGSREYRDGNMQVWSAPIGVTVKKEVSIGGGQLLLPELTLAYVGDVSRRNPSVKSTIYGIDSKHEGSNPGRSAIMVNAGTNWIINQNWSASAFYTLEARKNQINQSASLSARYSF